MGLSISTVQEAYSIFHEIKTDFLPELRISAWPSDMATWSDDKKENPPLNEVLGWDRKSNDGWENICFFIENPPRPLIKAFQAKAKARIHNSMICGPYKRNEKIWCIGWF